MPRGASPKRERQFEHIKESTKKSGRYGHRAEEVAARTVNKIRREKGETKTQRSRSKKSSARTISSKSRAAKSRAKKSRPTKSRSTTSATPSTKTPTSRTRRASGNGPPFTPLTH